MKIEEFFELGGSIAIQKIRVSFAASISLPNSESFKFEARIYVNGEESQGVSGETPELALSNAKQTISEYSWNELCYMAQCISEGL